MRKSVRGKKGVATHERENAETESLPAASLESSSLDKNVSVLSSDDKPNSQKTQEKPESQPDVDAASAGQQQQPECLDNQTQEGPSRSDVKGTRSCFTSKCADFKPTKCFNMIHYSG